MVLYRRTSILDSTAQTLVNTVNCVGVMGKGLAKAFKERDPAMYKAYKNVCERKMLAPGKLWLWQGSNGWILNFPTKQHWRDPSRLEWIEAGLEKFVLECSYRGIKEISFPRLGCGNGGLDWNDVRPLMERYLSKVEIPVYIHDYTVDVGLPEHLEYVANCLRSEGADASNFESFMMALKRVAEIGKDGLVELGTGVPFAVDMDPDGNLSFQSGTSSWVMAQDDLRGVWLILLSGLITKAQAEWSVSKGGNALLSMLSILPQARPIQIEEFRDEPEIAVELLPTSTRTALIPESDEQAQFTWA
jgi:O-acetyl-ADP-ribose deacetylase (regulator of RNase III)